MSWTQPICDDCWDERHPDNLSPREGGGHREACCFCDEPTYNGIYIRIDPASVPYPSAST